MIRRVDEVGRIVLSTEMRSKLHLGKEDAVNIECIDDKIILTRVRPSCIICHSAENPLSQVNQTLICSDCIKKIKSL